MDFQINAEFAALDDAALTEYATAALDAYNAHVSLDDLTDEQIAEAEALAAHIEEIAALQAERETEATARADRLAGLRTRFSTDAPEDEDDEDEDDEPEDEADEDDEVVDEVVDEPEKQPAPARVKTLARKVSRPAKPARSQQPVTITAAADVPGFSTSQDLDSLTEVAKAVINRAKGFGTPSGDGQTISLQQFGTAAFHIDFPEDLIVDKNSDVMEVMDRAVDESRLDGGSLVAAGGWCAPSETMYDLTQDATMDGLLSLAEIGVRRGGIRFAQSPTFADFYANPGFKQTEAQAIAGTTKPCVEVDCPDFTEVRLDAVGICIKVPILTNVGYPEVVRNFIAGTMVAHAHWVNADVIGRLVTDAGAARVFTGLGSTYSDTIEALGLVIDQTRQKYRLSLRATVEVVVPFWVKNALRVDLSRRNGRPTGAVTDAEIAAQFSAIGANVQYVYDWQDLDLVEDEVPVGDDINAYPADFDALVYPAGTYVKGSAPVINLNTVYDAASLAVNTYTGLFMEEGLLVAKRKFDSDLLTLPICNAGRTGAANFTCS